LTEINLYNNCREKCAIVTSIGRGLSSIIVVRRDPMRSNYPERKTILCIDDDDSMLGYQKALLERRG
jgi:hypothetical protein